MCIIDQTLSLLDTTIWKSRKVISIVVYFIGLREGVNVVNVHENNLRLLYESNKDSPKLSREDLEEAIKRHDEEEDRDRERTNFQFFAIILGFPLLVLFVFVILVYIH